jgi:transcriptional regulator with XRE-family HTH domain
MQKASEKLVSEEAMSIEERRLSTNLNSSDRLIGRIKRGPKDRAKLVGSHLDKGIAYQIRALRDRQGLSQEQLAAKVGMNQNAISRLESPQRGRPTITTLKRLAETFDVALVVRFIPFTKLVKWVSGTSYVEEGLSTDALAVPSFEEEEKCGAFQNLTATPIPEVRVAVISTSLLSNCPWQSFKAGAVAYGGLLQPVVGGEFDNGINIIGRYYAAEWKSNFASTPVGPAKTSLEFELLCPQVPTQQMYEGAKP